MEDPDPAVRDALSREWALWEDTHVAIGTGRSVRDPRWEGDDFRHAFFRLTAHYWAHDGFCDPPLLERTDRLRGIPGILVHGRRDVSSPVITPWRLHSAWPGSELVVHEGGGHGGTSTGELWRDANARMAAQFGPPSG